LQLDVSQLSVGDLVWKNRDPALEAQLRASYEGKSASDLRKTPVQVRFSVMTPLGWVQGRWVRASYEGKTASELLKAPVQVF
jgi:hypothetical protein